jgi:flagellar motor switch protein FliG
VARRITYAISQTGSVSPTAVDRIGLALAAQLHDVPESAFTTGAVERVGAILNSSTSITRDEMMEGLEETDQDFAALVRRAIFTFEHIPTRIKPADIPRIVREVEQPVLVKALSSALASDLAPAAEYILENMGERMADAMREEIAETGTVRARDADTAMREVINAIRRLEAAEEITLQEQENDSDAG